MKKRPTHFILCLLLAAATASGQSMQFGLTGNLGVSQLSFPALIDASSVEQNNPDLSGSAGFFIRKKVGKRWVFGTELLIVQIQGRGRVSNNQPILRGFPFIPTAPRGLFAEQIRNHLTYVGVPVYCGFRDGPNTWKAGMQLLYLSKSGYNVFLSDGLDNGTRLKRGYGLEGEVFQTDLGLKLGYERLFSPSFSFRADLYMGMYDISDTARRNRQLTLGLNYFLTKTDTQRD